MAFDLPLYAGKVRQDHATPAEMTFPKSKTKLFFLVGSVRSGTTLLRLLLSHHPDVSRCEEMDYVTSAIGDNGTFPGIDAYHRYLRLHRGFRATGYRLSHDLEFKDQTRGFLLQRASLDRTPIVGATVHHRFDRLPVIWPEARYIFLSRDPRDVARSCVQKGWAGSAWHGADFWIKAQSQWHELQAKVPADRLFHVHFETLVRNQTEILAEICEFLGTQFVPEMINIEHDSTYSRPDPALSNSWRKSATIRQIRQVESRIGQQALKDAGYAVSGYPPFRDSIVTRLAIWIEDLYGRIRLRSRRYGWKLWLSDVVARRLPAPSLAERIKLEMDAVDNRNLK